MRMGQKIGSILLATLSVTFLANALNAQGGPTTLTPNLVNVDVRMAVESLRAIGEVVIEEGLQGKVTLVSDVPMTPEQYRSAMNDRLRDLGYEITDRNGVLHVGPIQRRTEALQL